MSQERGDRPGGPSQAVVGAVVVGADGMLGRAITAQVRRLGGACAGERVPATPVAWSALRRTLVEKRPAVVYWAAPERAGIGRHRRVPATLAVDAMATFIEVIEACRAAGVPRLVNVVPHCAYPGDGAVPLREDGLWDGPPDGGLLAYGAVMRATVALATAYRNECGPFTMSPIVTGLFGPGDVFDAADGQVVGAMVRRFSDAVREGEARVACWGDGAAERELLYVDDAARWIVALGAAPEAAFAPWPDAVVNVGGPHAGAHVVTMAALAEAVAAAVGFGGRIEWDPTAPRGRVSVALDDGRLARIVPRTPVHDPPARSLADGLARTVADHRGHTIGAEAVGGR